MDKRIISWFSCGAASSYATYLTLKEYKNIEIIYCHVKNEHKDNLRFLKDFEKRLNIKIKILIDKKFDGDIFNVFRYYKFIKNTKGALCTSYLKKELRKNYQKYNDIQIFGYTCEEIERINLFIDSNQDIISQFPLARYNINKKDCLNFINDLNIDLPIMYKLGYQNNNCIGCVKDGMGYWNKIRIDFPEKFKKMAEFEREIGYSICKDKNGPVFLDELNPNRGNYKLDKPGNCGFVCEYDE